MEKVYLLKYDKKIHALIHDYLPMIVVDSICFTVFFLSIKYFNFIIVYPIVNAYLIYLFFLFFFVDNEVMRPSKCTPDGVL